MTNQIKNFTLENFEGFKITSNFSGTKMSALDPDSINRHYEVCLTRLDTGKSLTFDLWTSRCTPVINSHAHLIDALFVFLDACLAGYTDYEEHCFEVGYDINEESKAIHDTCVKYLQEMENIYKGNLCDLHFDVNMQANVWTDASAL